MNKRSVMNCIFRFVLKIQIAFGIGWKDKTIRRIWETRDNSYILMAYNKAIDLNRLDHLLNKFEFYIALQRNFREYILPEMSRRGLLENTEVRDASPQNTNNTAG